MTPRNSGIKINIGVKKQIQNSKDVIKKGSREFSGRTMQGIQNVQNLTKEGKLYTLKTTKYCFKKLKI